MSIDPGDGPEELRAFQQDNGYPGTMVLGSRELLADFNILTHSSKVGVDRHGIVAFRAGYGEAPMGDWETALEELARR